MLCTSMTSTCVWILKVSLPNRRAPWLKRSEKPSPKPENRDPKIASAFPRQQKRLQPALRPLFSAPIEDFCRIAARPRAGGPSSLFSFLDTWLLIPGTGFRSPRVRRSPGLLFKRLQLAWIVRNHAHLAQAQIEQHFRALTI